MALLARFLYHRSVERQLAVNPLMVAVMKDRADSVERAAKDIAQAEAFITGGYRDSIKATAGIELGRAIGRVNAFDKDSAHLEFGTSDTAPVHTLKRALQKAGLIQRP